MYYLITSFIKFLIFAQCSISLFANTDTPKKAQNEYWTNANVNYHTDYDQVPKDELLYLKVQAAEPLFFYKGPLRGKGLLEPFLDALILTLRHSNIITYTDYVTGAKANFYRSQQDYLVCAISGNILGRIKQIKNLDAIREGKYTRWTIPYGIRSPIEFFAIQSELVKDIDKYKFPGTNIYNIKDILDDPDLYTAQIIGMRSAVYIYLYPRSETGDLSIEPQYKKRVYEFVASGAEQIVKMLQGKRMHWADMGQYFDYHIKNLNIGPETMVLLDYAHKHPKEFKDEDLRISLINCTGPLKYKNKIDKIIEILNKKIRAIRTDLPFWKKSYEQYLKDTNQPFSEAKDYYLHKMRFEEKKKIDSGIFD